MLESIKKFAVRAIVATDGWLVAVPTGIAVVVTAVCLIFVKKRARAVGATCLLCAATSGLFLCAARLAGADKGAVMLAAWSVAALLFALWLGAWGLDGLAVAQENRRKTQKLRRTEELEKKLEKPPLPPLAPFAPKMGERTRKTQNPLMALPSDADEPQPAPPFFEEGKEHAQHLIELLRAAPLSPADSREVDFAERTIRCGGDGDYRALGQAYNGLIRLVARYGV